MDFSRELEVAEALARQAGAAILARYTVDLEVKFKDAAETDPVTQADKDANRIIVEGLAKAFPADGILAEESADSAARLSRPRLWCVDPLDGTREFVDKNGQFVVMIGLAVGGRARAGVVYQPTEDLLWWGADGMGAGEVRPGGERVALAPTKSTDPKQATMMVSRSHPSKSVAAVAASLGIPRALPLGSVGLKVARVATTFADLYISLSNKTQEWDACAPDAILSAAGGRVTDCLGAPLLYNKPDPCTPHGILATNGALHAACVRALAPACAERGWSAP
jgi:3'(2'), 5'-bisphosphate nucleotidase